jgi:uncharacterized protein YmfQ (DUF2313 family)
MYSVNAKNTEKFRLWLVKMVARAERTQAKWQSAVNADKARKKRIHLCCLVAAGGQLTAWKNSLDYLLKHKD